MEGGLFFVIKAPPPFPKVEGFVSVNRVKIGQVFMKYEFSGL